MNWPQISLPIAKELNAASQNLIDALHPKIVPILNMRKILSPLLIVATDGSSDLRLRVVIRQYPGGLSMERLVPIVQSALLNNLIPSIYTELRRQGE